VAERRSGWDELFALFVDARSGDASARDALLRRLRPPLLRFIRKRVGRALAARAVAEDLTQEVLIRVSGAVQGCEAQSEVQLLAWVFTVARHAVIDWRRRRAEEHSRRNDGRPLDAFEAPSDIARTMRSEADRVLGEVLLDAQTVLSPGTQEVIRQRLLYGARWRAAGEAVGTTAGGAKRRWQRAIQRLASEVARRVQMIEDDETRREVLRRVGRTDDPTRSEGGATSRSIYCPSPRDLRAPARKIRIDPDVDGALAAVSPLGPDRGGSVGPVPENGNLVDAQFVARVRQGEPPSC